MFAYVRNKIVPFEDAFLHVSDLSVQRGYGIFDFFKISNGHVYFLDDYLDRFYASAKAMNLSVPLGREQLIDIIFALIQKNGLNESGMKLILTGGYSGDGYQPGEPNLLITQQNLTLPPPEQIQTGVRIITHEFVRDIPAVKTINYSMGIWLLEKIKQEKAYDVLYHQNEVISEFPRCNFFIVKDDDTILTPAKNVLSGITRKNILKIAEGRIFESTVTLADLANAKEAFLTSTTKRIVPIVEVDGKAIGGGKPGKVSASLLEQLIQLERQDEKQNARPKKI
jgi:branched-chain amino acid aminotransferase